MRPIFLILTVLALAACATARVSPEAFTSAEQAILAAEQAGAEELAPVELKFARDKLEFARKGEEKRKYDVSLFLVEESEINSELAIEKSRTAKLRRKVNELRRSNEMLREELEANYGESFE